LTTKLASVISTVLFQCYSDHPHLHSFPTRRSSDLPPVSCRANSSGGVRSRKLSFGEVQTSLIRFPSRRGPRYSRRTSSSGNSGRSEEHTSELQSHLNLVCRLLLEKKNKIYVIPLGE